MTTNTKTQFKENYETGTIYVTEVNGRNIYEWRSRESIRYNLYAINRDLDELKARVNKMIGKDKNSQKTSLQQASE